MPELYTPSNWYWVIGGSSSQVYSSARAQLVPVTDAAYVAWHAAGNIPTAIDTENNLLATLFEQSASGLTITSTSTPALNGTYSTSPALVQLMEGTCIYILMNSKFPGGASTINWPDLSGATHTFPNTALFQAFATAVADYVDGMRQYINGTSTSLPSNAVTIA